ncbi:MAG: SLBB domain-containing protein [Pirellulales bacterium]|nr:SLBB domain-containing protein [Pirellulales bacterium]
MSLLAAVSVPMLSSCAMLQMFTHRIGRIANLPGLPLAVLLAISMMSGCKSVHYRADRLPVEFRKAASKHGKQIDLAQIAQFGISESVISPRDLIEVTVATGYAEENVRPVITRVSDEGNVDIPVIGTVPVAGIEAFDASKNIAQLGVERGMYLNPHVTVAIKEKSVNRVTVLGAVKEPGVHKLPRGGCDLMSALAASGGLTEDADTIIEIVRQPSDVLSAQQSQDQSSTTTTPDKRASEIQLAAYQGLPDAPPSQQLPQRPAPPLIRIDLSRGQFIGNDDYRLNDRDVVRVVRREQKMVYVSGLVARPGQVELPYERDIHLLDAIALSGGLRSPVADKVIIIRRVENHPEPITIQASYKKAKKKGLANIRLAAGDTITVEQTAETVVVDVFTRLIRFSVGVAGRANLF